MKVRRAAALSAALVLIGATAASAAGPPYRVAVGGNSAPGTSNVSATSTGTVAFSARNNANQIINSNCQSVSGNATVTRGTSVNPVGSIPSTIWNGCTMPLAAMTIQQQTSWNFTGTGSNATAALTDSIAVFVGGVNARVFSTANPAFCSFTVTGQANGTFVEGPGTQQLRINETGYTGNLRLSNVSGCLGRVQSGNPVNVALTVNVTSPSGPLNLS